MKSSTTIKSKSGAEIDLLIEALHLLKVQNERIDHLEQRLDELEGESGADSDNTQKVENYQNIEVGDWVRVKKTYRYRSRGGVKGEVIAVNPVQVTIKPKHYDQFRIAKSNVRVIKEKEKCRNHGKRK